MDAIGATKAGNYIRDAEGAASSWMRRFPDALAARPAAYGLNGPDVASLDEVVGRSDRASAVAGDPATRTSVAVGATDLSRAVAGQVCRRLARLLKASAGIGDDALLRAGLRPDKVGREPIWCPRTPTTLRYADPDTPGVRRKPFGAQRLELRLHLGGAAVGDPAAAGYLGGFTRTPVAVTFGPADDGKVATYFARWAGRRGDAGPWSRPVYCRVAA